MRRAIKGKYSPRRLPNTLLSDRFRNQLFNMRSYASIIMVLDGDRRPDLGPQRRAYVIHRHRAGPRRVPAALRSAWVADLRTFSFVEASVSTYRC